ncbi:MAG: hypothetical protein WDN46_12415 [Methylocella sp.]
MKKVYLAYALLLIVVIILVVIILLIAALTPAGASVSAPFRDII